MKDEDMLMHRIKAHLASPDVYDPPTFKDMADRIKELGLREMQLIGESLEDAKRIKELEVRIDELEVVVKKLWRIQRNPLQFDPDVFEILSPLFEEQPHE